MTRNDSAPLPRAGLAEDLGLLVLAASRVPTVTRAEMVEVDRAAIEDYGISLVRMMENAGAWLADLTRRSLGGSCAGRRVGVVAGRGNNGGGGLVAARRLLLWGAAVEVLLTADASEFAGVPAEQLGILQRLGLSPKTLDGQALDRNDALLDRKDVLIDAVIGYGLRGAATGAPLAAIAAINRADSPVISLDVPSGLDADGGEAPGEAVRAAATLTLALPKGGFFLAGAGAYVGRLFLGDISIPADAYAFAGKETPQPFRDGPLVEVIYEGATLDREPE